MGFAKGRDMRSLRAAAALTAWVFLAGAGSGEVTLRDVLAAAMRSNPDLLQAGADLDVARGKALAAAGIDDFVLDAKATGRFEKPTLHAAGIDLGLTKPLPTGGSIGIRFLTDYSKDVVTESYTPAARLVWDQPLLRGIGVDAARADRHRAAALRDAAQLGRQNAAAVALREVATAYWELRFATEEVSVRKQLAASAREQLELVDANIKAGKMPTSARAEVLVAAGLREEEVFLSERSLLESALQLRQLAGMPIDAGETTLSAQDALDATAESADLSAALTRAAERNPALLAARANGRAARVDVEVTENGLLPQLDLSVLAGPFGNAPDAGDAYDQMARFENYTVQGTLTFSRPIGNRSARGNAMAARAAWRHAQLSAEQIASQTAAAVVRAHALTEEGRRRLEVIAPTTDAAALDLAAERARFEVGRATNFDVLRRQEELAQTQLRQARARADLLIARAALWAVTGEIFERYGVTVK